MKILVCRIIIIEHNSVQTGIKNWHWYFFRILSQRLRTVFIYLFMYYFIKNTCTESYLLYAAGSLLGFKKKCFLSFLSECACCLERHIFTLCHFNDLLIATFCLTCTLRPRQRRARKKIRALRSIYLFAILLFVFG